MTATTLRENCFSGASHAGMDKKGKRMKTYRVDLKETIYFPTQIVEAESSEDAEKQVKDDWENGCLTCGDCDLEFKTEEK